MVTGKIMLTDYIYSVQTPQYMRDTDNLQYMEVKLRGMETMTYEKYLREMSVFSLKKK